MLKSFIHFTIILLIFTSCQTEKNESSFNFLQKPVVIDTSFIKNVKVDSIIVGYSTLTDLNNKEYNLIVTEEYQKDDIINQYKREGQNFYIDSVKHILVGTYENSEIISAVWLLNKYKGKLLGRNIDLTNYKVKNMIADFPRFEWSTTGSAKQWFYTNNSNHDTIVFYINLDTLIKRFPLNVNYYLDLKIARLKIEMSAWNIYGPKYGKLDTVNIKPLYSPLYETHSNYYLYRRKPGLKTTLREISSVGKKSISEQIKIGKWLNYYPDHSIKSIEYYNNGKIIRKN